MVRFKFLVFALLVIGLGLAHLPLVSGPLSTRALEGASAPNAAAISEVARSLQARRLAVQSLALTLAASPDLAEAVQPQVVPLPRGKGIRVVEPPTDERFSKMRGAIRERELIPEPFKGSVVLALSTNDGSLYARADGEAASDAKLDVAALVKAGSEGLVVDAFDAPYIFFSVPVLWNSEGGAPQVAATVVVGAPLEVDEKALQSAALSSGVAALALVRGDKVLGTAGSQRELADEALKNLQAGQNGHVVQRGGVRSLMAQLPNVKLPVLTRPDDFKGGEAPLAVGSRKALESGFEAVAVSSTRPFMMALADYQQTAFFGLAGLLGFSLVWTLVMGLGLNSGARAPAPKAEKKDKKDKKKGQEAEPAFASQASAPLPVQPSPEPPVPSPDDFTFPAAPPPVAQAAQDPYAAQPQGDDAFPFPPAPAPDPYAAQPQGDDAFPFPAAPAPDPYAAQPQANNPFAFPPQPDPYAAPPAPGTDPFGSRSSVASGAAYPFPPPEPPSGVQPAAPRGAFAFEDHPTAAYSLQQAADPFAAASAQAAVAEPGFGEEDPSSAPETTRVAAIPQELLRAARPATAEMQIPPGRVPGHPGVAGPALGGMQGMGQQTAPYPTMPHPIGSPAANHPAMGNSAVALSEDQHFQDVFREFVATREQCGEPNDGLTYDKFVAKLRKNKEQLVQKYACKTVRFQVYVKEGKAALKATPVKD